jgi:hypothetical protein
MAGASRSRGLIAFAQAAEKGGADGAGFATPPLNRKGSGTTGALAFTPSAPGSDRMLAI